MAGAAEPARPVQQAVGQKKQRPLVAGILGQAFLEQWDGLRAQVSFTENEICSLECGSLGRIPGKR